MGNKAHEKQMGLVVDEDSYLTIFKFTENGIKAGTEFLLGDGIKGEGPLYVHISVTRENDDKTAPCRIVSCDLQARNVNIEKPHFVYEETTSTLRIMPQNYLVAEVHDYIGVNFWRVTPDLAAPLDMVLAATTVLMKHNVKHGTGKNLLAALVDWDKV